MPILEVEIVSDDREGVAASLAPSVADAAAGIFGTPPGRTWAIVRTLPCSCYAENGGGPPDDVRPVFVRVLKALHPEPHVMRDEAHVLADCIARIVERPLEHVHVIYEPPAAGRIAFGGVLVEG